MNKQKTKSVRISEDAHQKARLIAFKRDKSIKLLIEELIRELK